MFFTDFSDLFSDVCIAQNISWTVSALHMQQQRCVRIHGQEDDYTYRDAVFFAESMTPTMKE